MYWNLNFLYVHVTERDTRKWCFFFCKNYSVDFCGYIFRYAELLANSPDELREEWYYKVIMKKLAKYGLVGLY